MLVYPKQNSRMIGECIYCGSTESPLNKEHIIPKGLNGNYTLLKASCSDCAAVTSKFEGDVLKCLWSIPRNVLNMRTGKPKNRSTTVPLVIEKNGVQSIIRVKPSEYPLYLLMPELQIRGILENKPASSELNVTNNPLFHVTGPTFQDAASTYKCEFIGTRINYSPSDFGRTIAKIGYCAAVTAMGLSPLRNAPIRKIILGSDPGIGFRVGSWFDEPVNIKNSLHGFMVRMAGAECHANIRLFAQFSASEYHVVIGEVDQTEIDIDNWLQL
jgi:hypothetical protein